MITHYDPDHVGDAAAFVEKFPVRHIVDHSPLTTANRNLERKYNGYARPLKGAASATASCGHTRQPAPIAEDAEDDTSIGLLFTFGKFRLLDLADLEANLNYELVCPLGSAGA